MGLAEVFHSKWRPEPGPSSGVRDARRGPSPPVRPVARPAHQKAPVLGDVDRGFCGRVVASGSVVVLAVMLLGLGVASAVAGQSVSSKSVARYVVRAGEEAGYSPSGAPTFNGTAASWTTGNPKAAADCQAPASRGFPRGADRAHHGPQWQGGRGVGDRSRFADRGQERGAGRAQGGHCSEQPGHALHDQATPDVGGVCSQGERGCG